MLMKKSAFKNILFFYTALVTIQQYYFPYLHPVTI